MKLFNKNNSMIYSLVPKDNEHYQRIRITDDFTEVTNGHYLLRVSTKEEKKEDVPETDNLKPLKGKINAVISASSAREIEKAIPKKHWQEILNNTWVGQNTNEETIEFISTDLDTWKPVIAKKCTEKYPNTDSLMAANLKDKPSAEICFSPEYMEQICQQSRKAGINMVKLSFYGANRAMKIEGTKIESGQKITVLLMPMRDREKKKNEYRKQ